MDVTAVEKSSTVHTVCGRKTGWLLKKSDDLLRRKSQLLNPIWDQLSVMAENFGWLGDRLKFYLGEEI